MRRLRSRSLLLWLGGVGALGLRSSGIRVRHAREEILREGLDVKLGRLPLGDHDIFLKFCRKRIDDCSLVLVEIDRLAFFAISHLDEMEAEWSLTTSEMIPFFNLKATSVNSSIYPEFREK